MKRKSTRATNLNLLRHLWGGAGNLAKKLVSHTNGSYISEMARGKRPIDDLDAQQIEHLLKLPSGWLDRDHELIFALSNEDHALWEILHKLPVSKKTALLQLLRPGDA